MHELIGQLARIEGSAPRAELHLRCRGPECFNLAFSQRLVLEDEGWVLQSHATDSDPDARGWVSHEFVFRAAVPGEGAG